MVKEDTPEHFWSALQILADNIKFYRHAKGLRQKDLAENAGVNYRYLQDIEVGKVNVTMESAYKIATVLEVAICDLFTVHQLSTTVELAELLEGRGRLLDSIETPLAIVDTENRFQFVNKAYTELLGWDTEGLKGINVNEFAVDRTMAQMVSAAVKKGGVYETIYLAKNRAGEGVPVRLNHIYLMKKNTIIGRLGAMTPLEGGKDCCRFTCQYPKLMEFVK